MTRLNWSNSGARPFEAAKDRLRRERAHLFPINCAKCGHEGERRLTTEQALRSTFRCYICGHRQALKITR